MNQQQQPVRKNPIYENVIRTVTPFVPASETIHTVSLFKNQPAWLGCLFTSFATVWFLRRWSVVTTEENFYFLKWGFRKIDPKNVFKVPRKDVQYIGDTLTFTAPNESKPRKLYSGLIGGDTILRQELQNPGSFEVGSGGSIQAGAGVPQAVSQPEQTSLKTCPKCAEKIQLEALVCRFCGHQFAESEIQAVKQQLEEQKQEAQQLANETKRLADEEAAFREIESKKKSRRTWGWILAIVGGLLFMAGFCIGSLVVISRISGTSTQDIEGFMIGLSCISFTPLIIGLGLLGLGIYILRKKSNVEEISTQSVSVQKI